MSLQPILLLFSDSILCWNLRENNLQKVHEIHAIQQWLSGSVSFTTIPFDELMASTMSSENAQDISKGPDLTYHVVYNYDIPHKIHYCLTLRWADFPCKTPKKVKLEEEWIKMEVF